MRRVPLTPGHRRQRLTWAQNHQNWRQEWQSVLFTDESRFGRYSDSHHSGVWTRPNVPMHQHYCQLVYPFRGGTVMPWGEIFTVTKQNCMCVTKT
ncbi:hypothetical protein BDFB_006682 [Asbolus verrucosus]|uniref:Transposase Tc1-like domain-containing protein n=1 Tax=Asbolus verrucosus TaxID=1661398 RepID=A0A482W8X7_ASBVE|nr:hypothetical protein BDFB_006682 [Asbolus verrucosus]